jgi:hypothetical protein
MCLDSGPINHDDGDLPAKINDHSTLLVHRVDSFH